VRVYRRPPTKRQRDMQPHFNSTSISSSSIYLLINSPWPSVTNSSRVGESGYISFLTERLPRSRAGVSVCIRVRSSLTFGCVRLRAMIKTSTHKLGRCVRTHVLFKNLRYVLYTHTCISYHAPPELTEKLASGGCAQPAWSVWKICTASPMNKIYEKSIQ
jgi:hypothetical protein